MKTKLLGVFVEPAMFERLRVEAFKARCSIGEIVRRALTAYLAGRPRERGKIGGG